MVGYKVLGFPPLADYQFTGNMPGAIVLTSGPQIPTMKDVSTPPASTGHSSTPIGSIKSLMGTFNALLTNRMDGGPLFEASVRSLRWTGHRSSSKHGARRRQGFPSRCSAASPPLTPPARRAGRLRLAMPVPQVSNSFLARQLAWNLRPSTVAVDASLRVSPHAALPKWTGPNTRCRALYHARHFGLPIHLRDRQQFR